MTENYFEYAVDQKSCGKNRLMRVALIVGYILFFVVLFLVFCSISMPQLIAILPFSLGIIVPLTWRYVSVTHEYIISVGEIGFAHIYANRKRKEVLRLPVREALEIAPDYGEAQSGIDKIYDFRSESNAQDAYYMTFRDEKGNTCLVYFEATKKALKLMQIYNPSAVKFGKTLRY